MQGYERAVTSTVHEWVMNVPVDLKELEFSIAWARKCAEEIRGAGAGSSDDAGGLVILDESTAAMRVIGESSSAQEDHDR